MDITTMIVVALGALVVIAAFLAFSRRGNVRIQGKGPLGTGIDVQASEPAPRLPGAVRGEDLRAGENIEAHNRIGGDTSVERATARGSIKLSTENPSSDTPPKAPPPA